MKQYLKQGLTLRTETTINDTYDLNIGRRLENLAQLRTWGDANNDRLLQQEADVETARLEGPELSTLVRPASKTTGECHHFDSATQGSWRSLRRW